MDDDTSRSQSTEPAESAVNRRAFIRAGGVVGAVGLAAASVAACSAAGSSGSGTGNGSSQGQGGGGGGQAIANPAPTGPSQLGSVTDIAVGGGKVFASPPLVVTHPAAGQFKAFSGVCTHSGCTLSGVKDGQIDCPCHGCRFSAATGAVVKGPATVALPAVQIAIENGIARIV